MFYILDRVKPTATGIDNLPAWFLRLAAPAVAKPLAWLFNKSCNESKVPLQWKTARIIPLPKLNEASACADFRPISIAAVLSRNMEKLIVKSQIYPILQSLFFAPCMADQYAFRSTGSTTAAVMEHVSNIVSSGMQTLRAKSCQSSWSPE